MYDITIVTTQETYALIGEILPDIPWSFFDSTLVKRTPINTSNATYVGKCYKTKFATWDIYQSKRLLKRLQEFTLATGNHVVSVGYPERDLIVISIIDRRLVQSIKELDYDIQPR